MLRHGGQWRLIPFPDAMALYQKLNFWQCSYMVWFIFLFKRAEKNSKTFKYFSSSAHEGKTLFHVTIRMSAYP
jgi:hypothetical protein